MARSNVNRLVLIAVVFAAACTDVADPSISSSTPVKAGTSNRVLRDPAVRATVRAAVLSQASLAGVASPHIMLAVAAVDHHAAENVVSGSIVNDHSPVYVVQMTGGPFIVPDHPRGVPAPQGDVMTVTVDAQTYDVTDVSYTATAPDLRQIDSDVVDLLAP
jgi:hypothetical protein